MFKAPRSGEDHGNAVFVAGVDNFLVPDRATGLYHHLDSRILYGVNTIPKREERIGYQHAPLYLFTALTQGHMDRIHTTYLSRSESNRGIVFGVQNTVGFSVA